MGMSGKGNVRSPQSSEICYAEGFPGKDEVVKKIGSDSPLYTLTSARPSRPSSGSSTYSISS